MTLLRGLFVGAFVFSMVGATGCAMKRQTVSERTAVEQAVISQAADAVIDQLSEEILAFSRKLKGKSFAIEGDKLERVDARYITDRLRFLLLQAGLREVAIDDADLLVTPTIGHSGTDERLFFIGIPSIPIVVPGAGTINTPELVIFKRDAIQGEVRAGLFAKERESGALAMHLRQDAQRRSYVQYKALIIFGWAATDLLPPYGRAGDTIVVDDNDGAEGNDAPASE